MNLTELRNLVEADRSLGYVYPERPLHAFPHKGPRGHALDRYRDFLSMLVFRREIANNETQSFKVPKDRIFIHAAELAQEDQKLTGIGFIPGPYSYDDKWVYSLGRPDADEDTVDKYGLGTVLLTMGYYVEQITVESVSSAYAITRGINEGIRYATRLFTDSGLLELTCPDYFDQVACFSIVSGDGYSTDLMVESAGRRIAHLRVEVWIPEVALVDYRRLRVLLDFGPLEVNVRDGNVYPTLG
jgi:hypothetical protein